jgi:hypothetical protein
MTSRSISAEPPHGFARDDDGCLFVRTPFGIVCPQECQFAAQKQRVTLRLHGVSVSREGVVLL